MMHWLLCVALVWLIFIVFVLLSIVLVNAVLNYQDKDKVGVKK